MPPVADSGPMMAAAATGPVIGHRGAAGLAPENTLAGFVAARRAGCAWVEVDAKLTQDGIVVLFHDDTLDRTTDGAGAMAQTSWAALAGLDAGGWFADAFKGERVPTLMEALALASDLGLGVNVEIKPCPGRGAETAGAVLDILDGRAQPSVLVSSFDADALSLFRDSAPDIPRALLVGEDVPITEAIDAARSLGCEGLHVPDTTLDATRIAAAKAAGLAVRVYTVNDPARARALLDAAADAVFTDFPDRVRG